MLPCWLWYLAGGDPVGTILYRRCMFLVNSLLPLHISRTSFPEQSQGTLCWTHWYHDYSNSMIIVCILLFHTLNTLYVKNNTLLLPHIQGSFCLALTFNWLDLCSSLPSQCWEPCRISWNQRRQCEPFQPQLKIMKHYKVCTTLHR